MTELAKRTFTIFLLLSFLSSLYIFGNNTAFILFIFILSIYSLYEWVTITSNHIAIIPIFTIFCLLLYYFDSINVYYLSIITLFTWIIIIYSMFFLREQFKLFVKKYFIVIGLFIFSSFLFLLLNMYPYDVAIKHNNNILDNKHYFLFLITLTSSIDIFAYISGKAFGKNKSITTISPNKTLEGYLGSYFFTVLFFILFFNTNNLVWTFLDLFYLTTFVLLAFSGDLFMSFIKRIYNKKDTGNILPGHGGILDRLDSYFPTLPLYYLWLMT